jgi:regulator of nonsense transcripts 2
MRYIAELTKFRITPHYVVFHCIKVLLDDFSHANIELISQLLEGCGRFLFGSSDTSSQMAAMLETLKRKMDATHLSAPERAMLQNAFYYCNPPDRPAIQQKERSPMEQFIRKMIYLDLSKKTAPSILKKLRMLHWEDPEIFALLQKIFTKVWKLKYSNIYYLAQLAASLMRYHIDFVIALVDSVFEYIRTGLEMNLFVHNQRRLAIVRYLGELYNFRVIETAAIFDTLYLIIGFGYGIFLVAKLISIEGGRPRRGAINPLDLPNDFFRIHLVCALLDTCGQCFDRGSSKKKLDQFLALFQVLLYFQSLIPVLYSYQR